MKLNTNIASLKVLNTMNTNNSRLEKSIERLSSGYKINKAADDATGLAISRKMQVQIDALSKASENADDGISLIQTAEGALNEVHSILQRMRELAIQSSNGSLSTEDRQSAQSEIDMLKDEINRISSTVQFNSMNLLDGSIDSKIYCNDDKLISVISTSEGVDAGTYEFEIEKTATKSAMLTNTINKSLFNDEGKTSFSGTVFINGVEANIKTGMTENDVFATLRDAAEKSDITVSLTEDSLISLDGSGNNKSRMIFESQIPGKEEIKISGDDVLLNFLGITEASKNSTETKRLEILASHKDDIIAKNKTFNINGVEIKTEEDMTVDSLINMISETNIPGFAIGKDDDGNYLLDTSLFYMDGTDVKTFVIGDLPLETTIQSFSNGTEYLNGLVGRDVEIKEGSLTFDDSTKSKVIGFPPGTTVNTNGNKIVFTGPDGFEMLAESFSSIGKTKLVVTTQGRLDLQIGANNGQTMTIRIPNMSCKAIGIENVNIRTRETAEEAIDYLEEAIAKVSEVRSRLGAFQNRLDYTTNSLTSSEQNLTESLSRILDTDMAEEMSTYTQNNILAEAGISILAQANQRPQGILTLLQNMI